MTIEQANEYFSSLPEGFAPAEELRAALTADARPLCNCFLMSVMSSGA